MIVGETTTSASKARTRKPEFVSPATKGVAIALTGPRTANITGDISPGSAACGGSTASPRTCTLSVASAIPVGTYALSVTSYDALAIAGSFSAAHELATGSISGIIVGTGAIATPSIFLGGLITALGNPAYISEPATGVAQIVGFTLNPTDFDNEAITTSTANYTNPINVTLTESGGSGHETLYLTYSPA